MPVRFSDRELEALERRVSKTGLSRSAIVRKDFLENPETVLELKKLPQEPVGK